MSESIEELPIVESSLDPNDASYYRPVCPAGDGWLHRIPAGATLRIVDMEGNQAADILFYDAADPANRYCATTTIANQGEGVFDCWFGLVHR